MNKSILAAAALLACTGNAAAFDIAEYHIKDGDVYFRFNALLEQPGCVTGTPWQYRTTADTSDAAMEYMIVQAANNSISLEIIGTGTCVGGVEVVRAVYASTAP